MRRGARLLVLYVAKCIGMFALSRFITRRELRILCYHGAELADESSFRPKLFISSAKFESRMRCLKASKYPVVSLSDALRMRREGDLLNCTTVITIDDGWYGTYQIMYPILSSCGFPATLYIASYYLQKQTQVFNVAVDYLLWRTDYKKIDVGAVHASLGGVLPLVSDKDRETAAELIQQFAAKGKSATERQQVIYDLAEALGLDGAQLTRTRLFQFINADEAREMASAGVDLQLHTHRHRFPLDYVAADVEIQDNRKALMGVSNSPLVHFCYPSGEYTEQQIPWLSEFGIESATTTKRGINQSMQSDYELFRILDSEDTEDIEFEAEMSGTLDLLRRIARRIAG